MNFSDELIEKYIDTDPMRVAMATGNAELATAIKYLQRAKYKLPSWYESRCSIDSTLYEQCSSQVAAHAKFDGFGGEKAVDLTCGLGVDSSVLASHFKCVSSVEIDERKAEIARSNFNKLGIGNIEVFNCSAEEFVAQTTESYDLIYIDPSRVKDGKKVYSLEDSSPNIVELLPRLKELSEKVLIKLSPLFDVEECRRVFGDDCGISVLSTDNECKEVLVEVSAEAKGGAINHIISDSKGFKSHLVSNGANGTLEFDNAKYIAVADVAFYKSRMVEGYIATQTSDFLYSNFVFLFEPLSENFEGQQFKIVEKLPYKPKMLKTVIKSLGIKGATIHIKNFHIGLEQIKKELKIKDGGGIHLFCTTVDGKSVAIFAEKF